MTCRILVGDVRERLRELRLAEVIAVNVGATMYPRVARMAEGNEIVRITSSGLIDYPTSDVVQMQGLGATKTTPPGVTSTETGSDRHLEHARSG